jgi:DNA polymerase
MPSSELLRWYLDAGVDETIADEPVDRFQEAGTSAARTGNQQQPQSPEPSAPEQAVPETAGREAGGQMGLAEAAPPPSFSPAKAPPSPAGMPGGSFADLETGFEGAANGDVSTAVHLAQAAETVDELRTALESFDGCGLKKTATNLVFTDGNPEAPILFVGEGPGAEEDRQGLPFVGPSGKLLDKMLASIGLDRSGVLISNTVFWRPPGNRTPTLQETAVCMPFVERLIELVDPKVLVPLGGPAAKSLLAQTAGVGRLRGQWFSYSTPRLPRPIEATPLYHPAYLLRSPGQKRNTWRDLLEIKRKLEAVH